MREKKFDVIERQRGWDGYFKLDVYRVQHDTFDGGKSDILQREVLERGHAVAVLPYDPVRDEVVLIEQFRPGAISVQERHPDMPIWLTEIVAGIIEDGETDQDVARRETVTLYYGRVDSSNAGGLHGLDEEGEDIRVFAVSAEECFVMLRNGQLCNATATIAIQWLMLNRERIRKETGV